MSKKKKWTIIPLLFIAALILIILYFLTLHRPASPVEPLKAIPIDAAMIIQVNDFKALSAKITGNNAMWHELRALPGLEKLDGQLRFLDSLFQHVPEASVVLQQAPSFLSAHFTGKDRISLIHFFQLPSQQHEKKISDLIKGLVVNSGTIKSREYENTLIHEVVLLQDNKTKNFSFSAYRNILMISFSSILLEDAIRQLAAESSLLSLKGFPEIYATAGKNVDANVFINFQHFPKSLSTFFRSDFRAEVRTARNFAGWAELDVNLLSDMLLMNGFVHPPDSVSSFATLLINQAPQRVTADEFLPGSAASFLTLCLSDPGRYFTDYHSFLQDQGTYTTYRNTLISMNNAYGIDLPNEFTEIMDHEITLAFDPGSREGDPGHTYLLLRVKSSTQAEEKLISILTRIAAAESRPVSAYTAIYRFDNELNFPIYHLPVRRFTAKIFGNLYAALDEHYFTMLENYLIFGNSEESLKTLIHSVILNKTLKHDPAYQTFKNSLSPRSGLLFYCNLSKSQPVYGPYLTEAIGKSWATYHSVFQQVQVAGLQLYASNKMLYNNLLLKFFSAGDRETQTVWESKLDTLTRFKPVFVLNHQTRQNEVFVQDLKNNIYLINQVGRILWKVQLPESINSEVFQIDYFRNGKLQLLFSTRNMLCLIDRNGNFVDRYPVRLRSSSTAGVAVFDYDNNRDYRLFIPCEDRQVYVYSKEGSLIPGWQFGRSENIVTQPVQHFRIADRDFIVFGDGFRTYILDRKGNVRVDVDAYFPRSARNNYQLYLPRDGSGTGVVTTDTTGKIYRIGFNGKTVTAATGDRFTNAHYFDCKDLNGDGMPEFIFLEGASLTVYTHAYNRLFTHDFSIPPDTRPQVYQFSATDRKIGVTSRSENRIYLFNNTGELYAGFPLQGNTPFTIGNFGDTLSRFNLVVGSQDNYLYNYRVR